MPSCRSSASFPQTLRCPSRPAPRLRRLICSCESSSNKDEGAALLPLRRTRRQSLSFFISPLLWPLPFSMPMSLAWPADEPAAPTVDPLLPSPADEPPVPTVDAELEPEPAAEPPVPTLDELLPPPADEPPVPGVEAEPLPDPLPAAEPRVPAA